MHHVEISNSTGKPMDTSIKVDGKEIVASVVCVYISAFGEYSVRIEMPDVEVEFDGMVEDVVIE